MRAGNSVPSSLLSSLRGAQPAEVRGHSGRALLAVSFVVFVFACGARTELYVPRHYDARPDVELEAGADVVEEDVAQFPPLDASFQDATKIDCPPQTYVWAVSTDDSLLRFDPPSATFTRVARLTCPAKGAHPFSMAVDRKSIAYVEYDNGMLFAVDTSDGSCQPTSYLANELLPFGNFGMGYVTIGTGPSEQLFIAADTPGTLGIINTPAFDITPVGVIEPQISYAELTGTGDGHLYAFYSFGYTGPSYVAELDKTTGAILGQDTLDKVDRGTGWAFAFWGGDFYIFTYPGPQNTWRYDPKTKTADIVAHYSAPVVGAGVSTCAPE